MTKISKEQELAREHFRTVYSVDHVGEYLAKNKEPGYIYKSVTTNYIGELADNVQRHLDAGFEFVIGKEQVKDDRTFAPNSGKADTLRPTFIENTTRDGYKQVLMRIKESEFQEYKHKQGQEEIKRYLKAVGKDAKTMNEQGKKLLNYEINDSHEDVIDKKLTGDK